MLEGGTVEEDDDYLVGDANTDANPDKEGTKTEEELDRENAAQPKNIICDTPGCNEPEPRGTQPNLRRLERSNKGKRKTHLFAHEFQGDSDTGAQLLAIGKEYQEIIPLAEHEIEVHIV